MTSGVEGTNDPALLRERLRLLEADRKAHFETTQSQLAHNRSIIRTLRNENKELKAVIGSARRGPGTLQATEASRLDNDVTRLTLKLDRLRDNEREHRRKLKEEQEKLADVRVQSQPLLTSESVLTHKIRMLENRLDKSLIKYNEALAIQRTYDEIVTRLREERVGFDNQLGAIERTLKAKDFDYQELLKMSHAANHAKETAKRELQQFKIAFDAERKAKDRELAERKAYVQAKVDQTQRLERKEREKRQREHEEAELQRQRQLEDAAAADGVGGRGIGSGPLIAGGARTTSEDEAKLQEYEKAFRKIKEATGVSDVSEVLARFVSQVHTHTNLTDMSKQAEARIDQLKSENAELTARLEDLRYGGSGQLGSRRIVEEFDVHLAEAAAQTKTSSERYEHLARLLINVKAGVEHLTDKLSGVRPELPIEPMSDETASTILNVCAQKLTSIADEVSPTEVVAYGSGEDLPVDVPTFNRRVRLPKDAEDGDEDDEEGGTGAHEDPDDDVVLKRDQIKKLSANSIQRETKKLRRRRAKDRT